MRWKKEQKHEGDTRIVRRFLFWKKCFNYDVRWLEFAQIKQVRRYNQKWIWESISWMDINDKL